MAEIHITSTDTLPNTIPAEAKARIHEKLKALVEQELAKETPTLGAASTKPDISIHGSIEVRF